MREVMAAAYLTEGSSMCLWEDIFENRLSEGEMVCICLPQGVALLGVALLE